MKQAIHILGKDVRHLWPQLLLALAVQITFVAFEVRPQKSPFTDANNLQSPWGLVTVLMPVMWWYLIASVVYQEPLPGDRQFWVTRPYSSKSLLAAKCLFIFVFVNLPVLAADCFILTRQGFPVTQHWTGLAWRQIPFVIAILLPPLALGSLTRNLGQAILATLLILVRFIVPGLFEGIPRGTTNLFWIDTATIECMLALLLSAILVVQYRSRRTWLARAILAAFLIVPGFSIPLEWQLWLQARVKPPGIDASAVRISFDPARTRRNILVRVKGAPAVRIALPIEVTGVPVGINLVSGGAKVAIEVNGNPVWSDDFEAAVLEQDGTRYWETIVIPPKNFSALRGRLVTVRMNPEVTAVRDVVFQSPLESEAARPPGGGICDSSRWQDAPILNVRCRWAFRDPMRTRIHAEYPGWDRPVAATGRPRQALFFGEISDSPFPAGLSLSPVNTKEVFSLSGQDLAAATSYSDARLIFETQYPVAHFQVAIGIPNLRLEDYAVSAPEE